MEVCANGIVLHHSGLGPIVVSTVRHCSYLWLVEATRAVADADVPGQGTRAFQEMVASWILHGSADTAVASLGLYVGGAQLFAHS